jgi:hypothetical protein
VRFVGDRARPELTAEQSGYPSGGAVGLTLCAFGRGAAAPGALPSSGVRNAVSTFSSPN